MVKILFWMLTVGVFFLAGYIVGNRQTDDLSRMLAKIRYEMTEKTSGLEREVNRLRLRTHLFTAQHRLDTARTALDERNYGLIRKELKNAREDLAAARDLADPKLKEALTRLDAPLKELIAAAARTDSRLKSRLESFRKDLERAIES